MRREQRAVEEFMQAADQALPARPIEPDRATRVLRVKLIAEELVEFAAASNIELSCSVDGTRYSTLNLQKPRNENEALYHAADALADLLVVVLGGASAWGMDIEPIFDAVHESNMRKFGPGGYKRGDGKWIKPSGWMPPDFYRLIAQQQID